MQERRSSGAVGADEHDDDRLRDIVHLRDRHVVLHERPASCRINRD